MGENWYLGTADAVYQNLYIIEREVPRWVIVLSGDHIYKMDYGKMLDVHIARGASLTVGAIEVPRRAQYLRVIAAELQRIASHCLWLGTWCMDMGGALGGGATVFLYCLRERETILDLFEALTGARLLYGFHQIGGVRYDVLIEDNGPGIRPEEREKIFSKFMRGSAQAHANAGGSASDTSAHRGSAPIAARSLRLTASARWPMAVGGVKRRSKCTPSTSASTVRTSSRLRAGSTTAASSPMPTASQSGGAGSRD